MLGLVSTMKGTKTTVNQDAVDRWARVWRHLLRVRRLQRIWGLLGGSRYLEASGRRLFGGGLGWAAHAVPQNHTKR